MTHAARLTQKRLEGEILKLLEGKSASLYQYGDEDGKCVFCERWRDENSLIWCGNCPIYIGNDNMGCLSYMGYFRDIGDAMFNSPYDAIPGALAIYLWLFEL